MIISTRKFKEWHRNGLGIVHKYFKEFIIAGKI
jgi:hypothetical protein